MSEQIRKSWFTEAVIIAGTPFVAYFFAFIYESGRAIFFKMPLEFINIGLPQILIFTFGFWFGIALLLMLVDGISMLFPSGLVFIRHLMPALPGVIVLLICLFKRDYLEFFILFVLILVLICPQLILAFYMKKDGRSYFQRLEEWDKESFTFKINRRSFVLKLMDVLGRENVAFIFSLIFLSIIINELGQFSAVRQTKFLIPGNDSKQIVVGLYGDNAICAPFDRQYMTIKPVFTIYKLSSGMSFQSEEIGQLKTGD